MKPYTILQDGGRYAAVDELHAAINLTNELLGAVQENEEATFSVVDDNGELQACATNRRIKGTFYKQTAESGRKIYAAGEEEFDATDHVLMLDAPAIRALVDNDQNTDMIGLAHVTWHGPYYVSICESICRFFGVGDVQEITGKALTHARNLYKPQPPEHRSLTLSIKVKVRVNHGATIESFIENLDYSVTSNTVGVFVQDTEIISQMTVD